MTTNSNDGALSRALWEARRDGRQVRVDERDRPRDEASAYGVQRGGHRGVRIRDRRIQDRGDGTVRDGPSRSERAVLRAAVSRGVPGERCGRFAPHGPFSGHRIGVRGEPGGRSSAAVRGVDERGGGGSGRLGGAGVRDRRYAPRKRPPRRRDAGDCRRRRQHRLRAGARPAPRGATPHLSAHPVTLRINGEEVASGNSGMLVFGDPISGVVWLANHPELGARGLRAGDVVTTGTCTGITPLSPGDEAEADYGALGTVRARFSG